MKKLRIHYFQHVEFEGLGSIEEWITLSGHHLTTTSFFKNFTFPDVNDFDWLIIMGGSMSVHDEELYPWLKEEKEFIRKVIDAGKTVLGICLGSQLISNALGAKVIKNKEKEIGWFDIQLKPAAQEGDLFFDLGSSIKVFHWHGDTFELPQGAVHLASSEACTNQAYLYNEKVLAMQFHLEPTQQSLQKMMDRCRDDLTTGAFVQTEKEILSNQQLIESNRKILFTLLDRLNTKG